MGVGGADPRDATADFGDDCLERSIALVRQAFAKAGVLPENL